MKIPPSPKDLGPKYGRHMTVAEMYTRMGDKGTASYHKAAAELSATKHRTAKKKKNKETAERRKTEKTGIASKGEVDRKSKVGSIGKDWAGGNVAKALGTFMSLKPGERSAAMGQFAEDAQDAEDSRQGAEWTKQETQKDLAHAKAMGEQLNQGLESLAPFASALGKMRGMTQGMPMGGRSTRRNKTSGGDIVCHLLTIRNQVKLYHWQTKQFSRHKATDDLTAALDLNIDAFVESYMGRYGRPKVSGGIKLHNFTEAAAKAFVAKETKYLEQELPKKIGKTDSDLLNLRDTILGDLTKVSYLFTLA